MGSKDFRVGVVGAGWVAGARYVPCLLSAEQVRVVAIYDRDAERADLLARKAPGAIGTADWSGFVALGLDAVVICSPPWTHTDLTLSALEAGLHVLCEKPMALSSADARRMADAATEREQRLMIAHNFLFSRAVRTADRWLRTQGRLSYVAGVQMSSPRRRLPAWYDDLPAGLMTDESPHMLYTMQHFLGALELDVVRSAGDAERATPDNVEVLLHGPRGRGQLTMIFDAPISEWHVVLTGDDSVLVLDLFRDIAVKVRSDQQHGPVDILRTSARAFGGHLSGVVRSGSRYAARRQHWGHRELIHGFVEACRTGGALPVPLEDSLSVVTLAEAIGDQSSRNGG